MDWLRRIEEIRQTEPLPEGAGIFAGVRYERFELPPAEYRYCDLCAEYLPAGDFYDHPRPLCRFHVRAGWMRGVRGNRGNGRLPRHSRLLEV